MPSADFTSTQSPGVAAAAGAIAVCRRCLEVFTDGDLADFEAVIHPEAVNREAATQPPANRGRGPAAFYATALWLRRALADMRWDIHQVAADGDIIAVHTTAHARHTGPFVIYDQTGSVRQAFPPTGKTCSVTQTHWFRVADGKIIEHWANRDDMGMAEQFGWIPPSPRYLVRMTRAKRAARTVS
jgi:predicted ester cyclase